MELLGLCQLSSVSLYRFHQMTTDYWIQYRNEFVYDFIIGHVNDRVWETNSKKKMRTEDNQFGLQVDLNVYIVLRTQR